MIKAIILSAPILLLAIQSANAQELPAAASNRTASLSGAGIDSVKLAAKATRGVRDVTAIASLAKALVTSNILKATIAGKRQTWAAEQHPSLQRVILRRSLAAGEVAPTADDYLKGLRANQNSVSDAALLQHASAVVSALQTNGNFSSDESFVPIQQGGGLLGMGDPTGKQATEVLITERRIVFRRHVAGIPVVGRAGEFEVVFDAAGEVSQVEIPTDNYATGKVAFAPTSGRASLVTAFKAHGFSDLPALHGTTQKDGITIRLEDLQCGLVDDAGQQLQRGCVVRYHGSEAPSDEVVEL